MSSGWWSPNPIYRHFFTNAYMPDATRAEGQNFDEMQRMSTSPENALRIMAMNAFVDARKDARTITIPTLVLHIRDDMAVPIKEGREVAREIPDATFIELPGANHCMIQGHAGFDEFFEHIRPFLTEHGG